MAVKISIVVLRIMTSLPRRSQATPPVYHVFFRPDEEPNMALVKIRLYQSFSEFKLLLISSRMQYLFFTATPKYFNFTTISKNLLAK
jgi:hypothetical protein